VITIVEDMTQEPHLIAKKVSNHWVARICRKYMVWLRGVQERTSCQQCAEQNVRRNHRAERAAARQASLLGPRTSFELVELRPPLPTYAAREQLPDYASMASV
jgi:hypothetical protein